MLRDNLAGGPPKPPLLGWGFGGLTIPGSSMSRNSSETWATRRTAQCTFSSKLDELLDSRKADQVPVPPFCRHGPLDAVYFPDA